ncbi:hypothetical protein CRUP_015442 [Coryphaenoides rupestris]|nr:hypothetical protein CRUP_015442 [Coryphaenoides rupestris]
MHAEPLQRRRKRTTFSKAQLGQLERAFSQNQYPDVKVKENLSSLTGLPESKIQPYYPQVSAAMCGTSLPHTTPSPTAYGFTPGHLQSPSLPESTKLSHVENVEVPESTVVPSSPGEWIGNPEFTGLLGSTDRPPACVDTASPEWSVSDGGSHSVFGDNYHGSRPAVCRCCTLRSSVQSDREADQNSLFSDIGHRHQNEALEDLSELSFHKIGECDLSDLDISEAMIDYILG